MNGGGGGTQTISILFSRPFRSPVSLLCWLQCSCLHHPGCRSCVRWKVSPTVQPSGRSSVLRSNGHLEENKKKKKQLSIFQGNQQIRYQYLISSFTQLPESRHHVNKCGNALAVLLWQVSFEKVAQGEQVVGQVHAVVVLDGSQVRELEQVLSGRGGRERETTIYTFWGEM